MIYAKIDIAKETHVAAAVNTGGVILLEPFAFQNNHDGFQLLKTNFDTLNKEDLIIDLDPVVNQSGRFNTKRIRMSKHGSKVLRYAMLNSAWNVSLNNDTFKCYYDSKIAQGNSHYNALGHTAHKLVSVIFKLWTDNIAFVLL